MIFIVPCLVLGMKIEENDAILELSKQWLYRKCENYVTFLKNYVTFNIFKVFNFIQTIVITFNKSDT